MRKGGFTLLMIFFSNYVLAQVNVSRIFPICDSSKNRKFSYLFTPNANIGSHINGLGVDFTPCVSFHFARKDSSYNSLSIHPRSGIKYYLSYLGIPGTSFTVEEDVGISYSFGKHVLKRPNSGSISKHAISYFFIGYWSTDNTSQFSGRLKYTYNNNKVECNYIFEDDFLGWQQFDQFRTSAIEVNRIRKYSKNNIGVGLNLTIWTGTTKGLGFLNRNQSYNLENQYGGKYSNGILCLKFYYNNINIGIGYDSEKIRDYFQNNFHYIIDDGKIPQLDRKGRIFIQCSIYDLGSLY